MQHVIFFTVLSLVLPFVSSFPNKLTLFYILRRTDADDFGCKSTRLAEASSSPESRPFHFSMENLLLVDTDQGNGFSSNVSYFFLRDELGLSEEAMWKITFEAGSALGMTAQTLRKKVEVLQKAMNLSAEDVRLLLEKQPTLLHLSADNNLAPTIDVLRNNLKLKKADLRRLVLASPSILTYQTSTLLSKIHFFVKNLGFSQTVCKSLWMEEPRLMRASVKTGLEPRLTFFRKDLEISDTKIRRILRSNPRILICSLDGNLIPKLIFYLILTLHMSPSDVERLLLRFPQFVNYGLDTHISPVSQYFLQGLDYSTTELKAIMLKFPRLISFSLPRIKRRAGYLRFQVGLNAMEVKRVLYQAPQVVSLREENIEQKLIYLRSICSDSKTLIVGMPTLLLLSIEDNLRPKHEFLLHAFNNTDDDLDDALCRLPTLLGYSLEKRVKPRMQAILSGGLPPSSITIGIPMSEDNFWGWVDRRIEKQRSSTKDRVVHWSRTQGKIHDESNG